MGEHRPVALTDAAARRSSAPPIWRGLSLESLPLGGISRRAILGIAVAFGLVVLALVLQLTVLK